MASFTQFLRLLKKSPITDGDDTFNVDTMLNDNWDKIEAVLKDTTTPATTLGLSGDKSVGQFLSALAKAGDLNVWRRKNGSVVDYPVSVNPNAFSPSATIESLGKLGDKARIEVGSYVGTGTYGAGNPNSITCSFAPKVVIVGGNGNSKNTFDLYGIAINPGPYMTSGYKINSVYTNYKNRVTWRNNGISWYFLSSENAQAQYNDSEVTYYWVAIG